MRQAPTSQPKLRKQSIDLGLDVIESVRRPGQTLNCQDIATVCGVSHSAIKQIYRRAIKKLQQRAAELREADL